LTQHVVFDRSTYDCMAESRQMWQESGDMWHLCHRCAGMSHPILRHYHLTIAFLKHWNLQKGFSNH